MNVNIGHRVYRFREGVSDTEAAQRAWRQHRKDREWDETQSVPHIRVYRGARHVKTLRPHTTRLEGGGGSFFKKEFFTKNDTIMADDFKAKFAIELCTCNMWDNHKNQVRAVRAVWYWMRRSNIIYIEAESLSLPKRQLEMPPKNDSKWIPFNNTKQQDRAPGIIKMTKKDKRTPNKKDCLFAFISFQDIEYYGNELIKLGKLLIQNKKKGGKAPKKEKTGGQHVFKCEAVDDAVACSDEFRDKYPLPLAVIIHHLTKNPEKLDLYAYSAFLKEIHVGKDTKDTFWKARVSGKLSSWDSMFLEYHVPLRRYIENVKKDADHVQSLVALKKSLVELKKAPQEKFIQALSMFVRSMENELIKPSNNKRRKHIESLLKDRITRALKKEVNRVEYKRHLLMYNTVKNFLRRNDLHINNKAAEAVEAEAEAEAKKAAEAASEAGVSLMELMDYIMQKNPHLHETHTTKQKILWNIEVAAEAKAAKAAKAAQAAQAAQAAEAVEETVEEKVVSLLFKYKFLKLRRIQGLDIEYKDAHQDLPPIQLLQRLIQIHNIPKEYNKEMIREHKNTLKMIREHKNTTLHELYATQTKHNRDNIEIKINGDSVKVFVAYLKKFQNHTLDRFLKCSDKNCSYKQVRFWEDVQDIDCTADDVLLEARVSPEGEIADQRALEGFGLTAQYIAERIHYISPDPTNTSTFTFEHKTHFDHHIFIQGQLRRAHKYMCPLSQNRLIHHHKMLTHNKNSENEHQSRQSCSILDRSSRRDRCSLFDDE